MSLVQFFSHCTSRTRTVDSTTFIKLLIDWLKSNEIYDGGFNSEIGFVSALINSSFIAFDTYYTHLDHNFIHSIVESVDIPKTFASNVAIPRIDDSNDINSNFNIVVQNDNQD